MSITYCRHNKVVFVIDECALCRELPGCARPRRCASPLHTPSNVTGYWWGSSVPTILIYRALHKPVSSVPLAIATAPCSPDHLPYLIWLYSHLLPSTRRSSDRVCSRKYLMHVLRPGSKDLRSNKHRQYFTALRRFIDVTELLYCPPTTTFVSLPRLHHEIKVYVVFPFNTYIFPLLLMFKKPNVRIYLNNGLSHNKTFCCLLPLGVPKQREDIKHITH